MNNQPTDTNRRKTTYLDARKKKATAKEKEENHINRSKQQGRNHNNLVILEKLISQELVRGVPQQNRWCSQTRHR